QRVRLERLRFELWMELHADEPGVIGKLDDFGQRAVGRYPRKAEPGLLQRILVPDVDFVAVAMALADMGCPVDWRRAAFGRKPRLMGAEPHRPAEIATHFATLQRV